MRLAAAAVAVLFVALGAAGAVSAYFAERVDTPQTVVADDATRWLKLDSQETDPAGRGGYATRGPAGERPAATGEDRALAVDLGQVGDEPEEIDEADALAPADDTEAPAGPVGAAEPQAAVPEPPIVLERVLTVHVPGALPEDHTAVHVGLSVDTPDVAAHLTAPDGADPAAAAALAPGETRAVRLTILALPDGPQAAVLTVTVALEDGSRWASRVPLALCAGECGG